MAVSRHSPRTHFGTLVHVGQLHIDNSTAYSKITVDSSGSIANAPGLRYSELTSIWEFSNNGIDWQPMGSGSAGNGAYKIAEFLSSPIPAETNHSLPGGKTYTMGSGSYMDVYYNGQLLSHDSDIRDHDYIEINGTTVKFHFEVPAETILAYII